jgi:hypothetical protein
MDVEALSIQQAFAAAREEILARSYVIRAVCHGVLDSA